MNNNIYRLEKSSIIDIKFLSSKNHKNYNNYKSNNNVT